MSRLREVPYDAVVSWHLNPLGCGVARFSARLAADWGIPLARYGGERFVWQYPLISVKSEEIDRDVPLPSDVYGRYDLFLHDDPSHDVWSWIPDAVRVYVADPGIRSGRADQRVMWCPGMISLPKPRGPGLRVGLFGMAHKWHRARLERLAVTLPRDACVRASGAVHEGFSFHQVMQHQERLLAEIFGDRLHWLGSLSDDAVADELYRSDLVAALYTPGVRANHTMAWSALAAGIPLITTLDAHSPPEMVHGVTVWDLDRCQDVPDASARAAVAAEGARRAHSRSWDRFYEVFACAN